MIKLFNELDPLKIGLGVLGLFLVIIVLVVIIRSLLKKKNNTDSNQSGANNSKNNSNYFYLDSSLANQKMTDNNENSTPKIDVEKLKEAYNSKFKELHDSFNAKIQESSQEINKLKNDLLLKEQEGIKKVKETEDLKNKELQAIKLQCESIIKQERDRVQEELKTLQREYSEKELALTRKNEDLSAKQSDFERHKSELISKIKTDAENQKLTLIKEYDDKLALDKKRLEEEYRNKSQILAEKEAEVRLKETQLNELEKLQENEHKLKMTSLLQLENDLNEHSEKEKIRIDNMESSAIVEIQKLNSIQEEKKLLVEEKENRLNLLEKELAKKEKELTLKETSLELKEKQTLDNMSVISSDKEMIKTREQELNKNIKDFNTYQKEFTTSVKEQLADIAELKNNILEMKNAMVYDLNQKFDSFNKFKINELEKLNEKAIEVNKDATKKAQQVEKYFTDEKAKIDIARNDLEVKIAYNKEIINEENKKIREELMKLWSISPQPLKQKGKLTKDKDVKANKVKRPKR